MRSWTREHMSVARETTTRDPGFNRALFNWSSKLSARSECLTHGLRSSGLCQDGNTSSRVITEVKHLELNQLSDGSNLLGSGKYCCRKVSIMGCHLRFPFPLARCIWFSMRQPLITSLRRTYPFRYWTEKSFARQAEESNIDQFDEF